ncbi:phosphotransferase family protein [Haliea atlantica]
MLFFEGWALCVKSIRSAILFSVFYPISRFSAAFRSDIDSILILLRRLGVLETKEVVTGFMAYTPRDKRRRSYVIIHCSTRSFFAKVGEDLSEEHLPGVIVSRLLAAGFSAQIPVKHLEEGQNRFNFYPYFNSIYFKKARLSKDQSNLFSATLNKGVETRFIRLDEYFHGRKVHPSAKIIFSHKSVRQLYKRLSSVPIELGICHGDLMSPNILCQKDGFGNILVLDWESFSENEPLILDRVGARKWSVIEKNATEGFSRFRPSLNSEATEAILFMMVSGYRGFAPAIRWLSHLPKDWLCED